MIEDPDRWHDIDSLFLAALDLPEHRRAGFLDRACDGAPALREGVEVLLRAHGEAGTFLEQPVEAVCDPPWADVLNGVGDPARFDVAGVPVDRTGQRLGPYRLTARIGRGGMATVYLAERADGQWEQRVALKVVRRGLDTEDVLRRFTAERQILSSLGHPNIARLLDGGTTDDGLPYLVMEHVEGAPITTYLDERRAGVDERLRLFLDVCRAVQYAHRNLVVHRDLKPANILVTGEGRVKLLDFGIAKILDPSVGGSATRTGFQPLTPEYASPEQVRGERVTTASDVYALGLLLCELLSGRRPYEVRVLSPARLENAILESRPARPSSLVTPEAAHVRRTRQDRLVRVLRGDLDLIVLAAVRKEPERRYASADALAADVERFRAMRPISARPDTIRYRARTLLRRRPWLAPATAAAALAAGAYLFTIDRHARALEVERNVATAQAERAEAVKDFLADVFLAANPLEGEIRSAGDLVTFGIEWADSALVDEPDIHFEVLTTLGRSAYWIGRITTARALLERTAQLEERVRTDLDPMGLWWGRQYLGAARYAMADYEAAESTYVQTIERYGPILGARSEPVGRTLNVLGWLYHETGDLERAERTYREALAIHGESSGRRSSEYATALENLGLVFADQGHPGAGEPLVRQALAIRRDVLGPSHPNTAFGLRSLGRVLHRLGDVEAAEALLRDAVARRRGLLGPTHHKFAEDLAALSALVAGRGNLAEARSLVEQALAIRRESLGEDHPVTAVTMHQLATILHQLGEGDQAESLYQDAVTALSRRFGPTHGWTAAASEDLERLRQGRMPAEREWLSGTRLPLPTTMQPRDLAPTHRQPLRPAQRRDPVGQGG